MSEIKLKNCPFCGSNNIDYSIKTCGSYRRQYHVAMYCKEFQEQFEKGYYCNFVNVKDLYIGDKNIAK